jgi:hypothetical protein
VPALPNALVVALIAVGLAQSPRDRASDLRVMTYNIDCNLDLQAAIAASLGMEHRCYTALTRPR